MAGGVFDIEEEIFSPVSSPAPHQTPTRHALTENAKPAFSSATYRPCGLILNGSGKATLTTGE